MSKKSWWAILWWISFLILGVIIITLMNYVWMLIFLFIWYLSNWAIEYFYTLSSFKEILISCMRWLAIIPPFLFLCIRIFIFAHMFRVPYLINFLLTWIPVKYHNLGIYILIALSLFQLVVNLYLIWTNPYNTEITSRISLTIWVLIVFFSITFTSLKIKAKWNELN